MGEYGVGDVGIGAHQNDVSGRRRRHVVSYPQCELHVLVVRSSLVSQIPVRRHEIRRPTTLGYGHHAPTGRVVLQRQGLPVVVFEPPFLRALRERGLELVLGVPRGRVALRGVPVTEARRATELVLHVEVEVTRFAYATLLSFHVCLAVAGARVGIAIGLVPGRSGHGTAAGFAPVGAEIVEVDVAAVALVSGDALFALALALRVALQVSGAHGVAVARLAVLVFELVEVFATTFAVRTIPVVRAVQAMSSVAGALVEVLVEEAAVGEVVTVAG